MPDSPSRVRVFSSDESLPSELGNVFSPAHKTLFESRELFRNFEQSGIAPGFRIRLYALTTIDDDTVRALLSAVYSRLYAAHPRAKVLHFSGVEGTPFIPWPSQSSRDESTAIDRVIEFVHADRHGYDVLRFSPLEPHTPVIDQVVAALRRTGHPTRVYEAPRASYARSAGMTSDAFLAARPRGLRAPLERARRMLGDAGRANFRLVVDDGSIDAAARDYERTEDIGKGGASPELPGYLPGLMRVAARAGVLRLGFLDVDGAPAAAQLWIVSAGVGHCLRIVRVTSHAELPLGDLLTMHMARHLIDVDGIAELEFGTVTAEFARNWTNGTRARVGVIAFNPRTWRGIKGTVRHVGLPKLMSIPRHLWRTAGRHGT
ncbi:MAG: GNAT family N-acetyltransferase [Betaproteobacteria bacterium]